MNYGEIAFDMNRREHPTGSQAEYLLKRWKKYTIYAKSGSYNRTENPLDNFYSTSSIYLYDYVVVSEDFYSSIVYTASFVDTTPAEFGSEVGVTEWQHRAYTFRSSSNAITNNYLLPYNPLASLSSSVLPHRPYYGYVLIPDSPPLIEDTPDYRTYVSTPIYRDMGEYFEIVGSYPRNHFTHKRDLFSLYKLTTYGKDAGIIISGSYHRNQQTLSTTIGQDGLEDGSAPVQATQVGNLNLIQSDNVINK
jgi:hypothetical protein